MCSPWWSTTARARPSPAATRAPRRSARIFEERLKAFPNLDVRWVNSTSTSGDSDRDGTMLFTDLAKGLADVPPDRLAGVIMLTDGNVHDVPQNAAALGFDAPVHALHHRQAGRVRPQARGAEGAALRPCRRRAAGRGQGHRDHAGQRRVREAHHHPSGRGAEHEERACRREGRDPGQGRSRRPEHRRDRGRGRARRTHHRRTTAPCSRSRACARICACCSSPASLMPASAPGATC